MRRDNARIHQEHVFGSTAHVTTQVGEWESWSGASPF